MPPAPPSPLPLPELLRSRNASASGFPRVQARRGERRPGRAAGSPARLLAGPPPLLPTPRRIQAALAAALSGPLPPLPARLPRARVLRHSAPPSPPPPAWPAFYPPAASAGPPPRADDTRRLRPPASPAAPPGDAKRGLIQGPATRKARRGGCSVRRIPAPQEVRPPVRGAGSAGRGRR